MSKAQHHNFRCLDCALLLDEAASACPECGGNVETVTAGGADSTQDAWQTTYLSGHPEFPLPQTGKLLVARTVLRFEYVWRDYLGDKYLTFAVSHTNVKQVDTTVGTRNAGFGGIGFGAIVEAAVINAATTKRLFYVAVLCNIDDALRTLVFKLGSVEEQVQFYRAMRAQKQQLVASDGRE